MTPEETLPVLILDSGVLTERGNNGLTALSRRYTVVIEHLPRRLVEFIISRPNESTAWEATLANEREGHLRDCLGMFQGSFNHTTGHFPDGKLVRLRELPQGVVQAIQLAAYDIVGGDRCAIKDYADIVQAPSITPQIVRDF